MNIENISLKEFINIHQAGMKLNSNLFNNAVISNRKDILNYLINQGCSYDHYTWEIAVTYSNLEICELLKNNDCMPSQTKWNEVLNSFRARYSEKK